MNTIYRLTTLFALTLSVLGADVKFSALPTATSPSTNSYVPIIDLNLLPAAQNQKYLLTNLATRASVPSYQTNVAAANPTATVATTAVNGSATTFMRSDAAPAIPASFITANQTNATLASLGGVAKTGGTDNSNTLYFPWFAAGSYQQYADSNTQSTATITLDFSSTNYHVIVLTGAVTFASSNLGTNRNWSGEFWNTQTTNCAVTWPSWRFVGGKTTTIDPAQTLRLFARVPLFANDTNVIAVSSQTQ